jgi:cation:H+ antiporter
LNNAIIAIEDAAYKQGPIFLKISPVHSVSALTALIMTGFAVIGFFYRPERRILKLIGVVSWVLLLLFLINSYFMYVNGHSEI